MGFGLGIERLLMVMENLGLPFPEEERVKVYIASLDGEADIYVAKMVADLREKGIRAEKDYLGRSLKAQLKYANKLKAEYTVVIGGEEVENKMFNLKNMDSGETKTVDFDGLVAEIGGK